MKPLFAGIGNWSHAISSENVNVKTQEQHETKSSPGMCTREDGLQATSLG